MAAGGGLGPGGAGGIAPATAVGALLLAAVVDPVGAVVAGMEEAVAATGTKGVPKI